jgi:hypothetical protein
MRINLPLHTIRLEFVALERFPLKRELQGWNAGEIPFAPVFLTCLSAVEIFK